MAFKDLMGRNETGESSERPPTAYSRGAGSTSPPTPTGSTTFLDSSTVFEGKLTCVDSLRIDGQVKGEIHCAQKVAIGETGSVHATIEADTVVVAGEVNGDITATRKVTLEKTGRVNGDLCTPGIVIQEGAKLEGRITIGDDAGAPAKAAAKTPAPKTGSKAPAKEAAKAAPKETPKEATSEAPSPAPPAPGH